MGSWYTWPDPKLGSCYNPNILFSGRMTQGFCSITVHLTPSWGPVGDPRVGFYWSSTDPTFGLYCRLLSHHPILGLLVCLLASVLPGVQVGTYGRPNCPVMTRLNYVKQNQIWSWASTCLILHRKSLVNICDSLETLSCQIGWSD